MNRLRSKGVPLRVAGTMSGTSLDGVDVAVLETDGERIVALGETRYRPYSSSEQETIAAAFGHWDGALVDAAARVVLAAHQEVLAGLEDLDLIGFHGQTLAHAPDEGKTLQVGDGAALAEYLRVPVVWDFRTADVKLGGQGAPLAPFYHWACARYADLKAPVAVLNLGGVGNVTFVDPLAHAPEAEGALLAFDTGPANAPINDFVKQSFGLAFDKDGKIAAQGEVDACRIERFLKQPYFAKLPPKSLDRNDFVAEYHSIFELSDNDVVTTLTGLCAACVSVGFDHLPQTPSAVYVTGGGRHHPVLMDMIAAGAPCPVHPIEALGFDGDMLEAQAFGYLAARVLRRLPTSCQSTTGVPAVVGGGTISRPETGMAVR